MVKTDFMTSSYSDSLPRRSRAFTLVEVLIAASLGTIVMAGVLSAFLMLVRSGVRVSNYSMMETQTRRAFEQLGIDARMANKITCHFDGSVITAFTLKIPNNDLSSESNVTYGYDASIADDKKFFRVPGTSASGTTGRVNLVSKVTSLTFLRYDTASVLIPTSTVSDAGVKHIQISISVSRADSGVAAATQVIRSSAFTMRNISL
jgi:Tfp pilus assembly protein PilW